MRGSLDPWHAKGGAWHVLCRCSRRDRYRHSCDIDGSLASHAHGGAASVAVVQEGAGPETTRASPRLRLTWWIGEAIASRRAAAMARAGVVTASPDAAGVPHASALWPARRVQVRIRIRVTGRLRNRPPANAVRPAASLEITRSCFLGTGRLPIRSDLVGMLCLGMDRAWHRYSCLDHA